jgi:hypothetical protein
MLDYRVVLNEAQLAADLEARPLLITNMLLFRVEARY